ncbi:fructose 1,6-bisphosphatase II [Stappia sp. 22II-S9-Z10]|nr:fructose 1,6-bisphosphatase II [Stappia sp. 22II-S9-Z10]
MAEDKTPQGGLDRVLTVEIMRVTERAAVAAARLRGRGDEKAADQAAVDAMRRELNRLAIEGIVVIGEGERDEAPMLYIGEAVGAGGQRVDIALDPLEGTTLCAKDMPNSIATLAMAQGGALLNAPDVYMQKLAVGPGYPEGFIELDMPTKEIVARVAKEKGVPQNEITACVLDRPRHTDLIAELRETGVAVRLISDGDVAGVINTTNPLESGIDLYIGVGAAPEGVLAAAALRCVGGQMQGRLILDTEERRSRAERMGISDPNKIYTHEEMAQGDVYFSATGVTDGNLVKGVRFHPEYIETETIVMRSLHGTVRTIKARHTNFAKFAMV